MMRSKVIRAAKPEEVLFFDGWRPAADEAEMERQIKQYCLDFKEYRQQAQVADGDIATVHLEAEESFFHAIGKPADRSQDENTQAAQWASSNIDRQSDPVNRTVKISVGKGFFDRELETFLIGIALGETASCTHTRAGRVTVTVTDIQRLSVPPLTDALVERGNFANLHTADEYRAYIRREMIKDEVCQKAYAYLDELVHQSVFAINEEELDSLTVQETERCRAIALEQGLVFEKMTSEQLLGAVGQPDIPSFQKMVREFHTNQLSSVLLYLFWTDQASGRQAVELGKLQDLYTQAALYLSELIFKTLPEEG